MTERDMYAIATEYATLLGNGSPRGSRRVVLPATLKGTIHADSVMKWNDAPERTHAEVLEAFDRAIAELSKAQP